MTPRATSHAGSDKADAGTKQAARRAALLRPQHVRFLSLQRAAGNGAVSRLVADKPRSPSHEPPVTVSRFAATALSGPTEWAKDTKKVTRPGEGVSGGVYILHSDPDSEIPRVVVKPIFGERADAQKETAEQLVFADRALAMLGISSPVSRPVQAKTPEFDQLLELVTPAAPKAAPENAPEPIKNSFKHVSAAESFVVMSEVPKGRSLASMAKSAGTDRGASRALYDIVFSHSFLVQLGRVAVGDMLVGNNDRLTGLTETGSRPMNLGNLMVSAANSGSQLFAIDTTAVLGQFDPKKVLSHGTGSRTMTGTWVNPKREMEGSGQGGIDRMLDAFFHVLINFVRDGVKPLGGHRGPVASPADMMENTYQANRSKYLASVQIGWDDALIKIFELVNTTEGRQKMKGLAGEFAGSRGGADLKKTTFKTNAMYLAGIGAGKGHDESSQDAYAYAARKWAQDLPKTDLVLPGDDLHWNQARVPTSALSADLSEGIPGLPESQRLKEPYDIVGMDQQSYEYHKPSVDDIAGKVRDVKGNADQMGTKKRLFKGEVTRNRSQAIKFVAESFLVGLGSTRAVATAGKGLFLMEQIKLAVGNKLTSNQASMLLSNLTYARDVSGGNKAQLKQYSSTLRDAIKGVGGLKKYPYSKNLVTMLGKLLVRTDAAIERNERGMQVVNPNLLERLLQTAVDTPGQ